MDWSLAGETGERGGEADDGAIRARLMGGGEEGAEEEEEVKRREEGVGRSALGSALGSARRRPRMILSM